ncbi:hypothetical protein CLOM_g10887 [Closterium sp. NIES-68]|nr:hypothetical protein CLOM_g10887 [Closterium sp. NIES-68]GJP74851.1 hypothetical protein CLOP_g5380 [Closterium sp. NIES-67]
MDRHVYALDFDGVLCDSCGESSLSAVKAAKVRWPSLFADVPADVEETILKQMREVRPVVETGYENILLVRLLLEMACEDKRQSQLSKSGRLTLGTILSGWEKDVKPAVMADWGEEGNREQLVELFGAVRDEWIRDDLPSWIAANALYEGVPAALQKAASPLYIVTTKQTRFALVLLRELAGVDFPEDKVFGLGTGPKVQTLQHLQSLPQHQGCSFHFVEDRLATLRNVINTPQLDAWHLYLGTWGYNTEMERQEATQIPRIQILELPDFCSSLK